MKRRLFPIHADGAVQYVSLIRITKYVMVVKGVQLILQVLEIPFLAHRCWLNWKPRFEPYTVGRHEQFGHYDHCNLVQRDSTAIFMLCENYKLLRY